jgi:prevent-host-death family protein
MKRISIRDLHLHTGRWIRGVAEHHRILVTDRGRPVAEIVPFEKKEVTVSFADRRVSSEFKALPQVAGDAAEDVADDRSRA